MSSSEQAPRPTWPLTLTGASPDATVTVFDGRDRVVWQGRGAPNLAIDLSKGLYTVRVELAGEMVETPVRLAAAVTLGAMTPSRQTAAPFYGAATSHEYYSDNARDLSKVETRAPIAGRHGQGAGLFVFVRALDEQAARYAQHDFGETLEILDEDDRIVGRLDAASTRHDQQFGWLAFCARASRGFYRLRKTGCTPREVAIHLFDGWQTQVFVLYRGAPRLESMKVFMTPLGRGFQPDDDIVSAIDLALDGLQNGIRLVPRRLMNVLLEGKFENPMLGIVGAHALLQDAGRERSRDATGGPPDPNLIKMVLDNLGWLIPDSPDLRALELVASRRFGGTLPTAPFRQPPMLRAGLAAVIEASVENPQLVPEDGIVDDIASRLFADSPWSSWAPLERSGRTDDVVDKAAREVVWDEVTDKIAGKIEDFKEAVTLGRQAEARDPEMGRTLAHPWKAPLDWVQMALLDAVEGAVKAAERKRRARPLDLNEMARRLGVTPHVVQRAARGLDRLPAEMVLERSAREWSALLRNTLDSPAGWFSKLMKTSDTTEGGW